MGALFEDGKKRRPFYRITHCIQVKLIKPKRQRRRRRRLPMVATGALQLHETTREITNSLPSLSFHCLFYSAHTHGEQFGFLHNLIFAQKHSRWAMQKSVSNCSKLIVIQSAWYRQFIQCIRLDFFSGFVFIFGVDKRHTHFNSKAEKDGRGRNTVGWIARGTQKQKRQ